MVSSYVSLLILTVKVTKYCVESGKRLQIQKDIIPELILIWTCFRIPECRCDSQCSFSVATFHVSTGNVYRGLYSRLRFTHTVAFSEACEFAFSMFRHVSLSLSFETQPQAGLRQVESRTQDILKKQDQLLGHFFPVYLISPTHFSHPSSRPQVSAPHFFVLRCNHLFSSVTLCLGS